MNLLLINNNDTIKHAGVGKEEKNQSTEFKYSFSTLNGFTKESFSSYFLGLW